MTKKMFKMFFLVRIYIILRKAMSKKRTILDLNFLILANRISLLVTIYPFRITISIDKLRFKPVRRRA